MLGRKEVYLNCSYMSPMLRKVEKAGMRGLIRKRRPHKISADDFFKDGETVRILFADLINCSEPQRIVTVPSVSYGISNVINNLKIKKGQNVVIAGDQFPSNVYPWMRFCKDAGAELKIIDPPKTEKERAKKWNDKILKAIDKDTVAVSMGQIHWADGTKFDLKAIRELTNQYKAAMVLDGTQSVGAMPFDVNEIDPDAVICAAYKMLMGPYSIGLAYYGKRFDEGRPVEENWMNRMDSENFAELVNYKDAYREGSLRFEVGEHSNFILIPMLIAALKQVRKWGAENIQDYCYELTKDAVEELRSLGLYIEDDEHRARHIFGVKCPKDKIEELKQELSINKVSVSFRGEFLRVAPHVYNDATDVKKLMKAFRKVFQN